VVRRESLPPGRNRRRVPPAAQRPDPLQMVLVPAGSFLMGDDAAAGNCQSPAHIVSLRSFWMDPHEVTNGQFAEFVAATGYRSTAERIGRSWAFDAFRQKWTFAPGADWRHPGGPQTNIQGLEAYPVVQISWLDAMAYAGWCGKRLPTEAEWEYAARAGRDQASNTVVANHGPHAYFHATGRLRARSADEVATETVVQSAAPVLAAQATPAPSCQPNRFGLFDMAGNVWEWCHDWYADDYFQYSPGENPAGPKNGVKRVQRGGSWLSAGETPPRLLTRERQAPDACHNHVGFRCVRDVRI